MIMRTLLLAAWAILASGQSVGPSRATLACREAIAAKPLDSGFYALDQPAALLPDTPLDSPLYGGAFKGVSLKAIPGGLTDYFPTWWCNTTASPLTSCVDVQLGKRGDAFYWVPDTLAKDYGRILYIHGGSFAYNSPSVGGYAPHAARLARELKMPVLVIDFRLLPLVNYQGMLEDVAAALRFLTLSDESQPITPSKLEGQAPATKSKNIYLVGDSAGATIAVAAMLAQAGPLGLPGTPKLPDATIKGAVLYSPAVNLGANSPTIWTKMFGYAKDNANISFGDPAYGHARGGPEGWIQRITQGFFLYSGYNPANPAVNIRTAPKASLAKFPPVSIHTGTDEVLAFDASLLAKTLRDAGAMAVELHLWDNMWHDFQMYAAGCGSGSPLGPAKAAMKETIRFVKQIPSLLASAARRFCTVMHYEYEGKDFAAGLRSCTAT